MPSFGRLDTPVPQLARAPEAGVPFRIAVLGDFSGRANRGEGADLADRKAYPVTREVLDALLDKLQARLRLPAGKDERELTFASLDHFHPDELHARVTQFEDCFDDEEKAELMSALLHHPDFQALESAWRGLDWLLRRVQKKDGGVEVVLYDISQGELATDLTATEDLATTGLYRLLIEQAAAGSQGKPWAVWLGLYTFDVSAEHAELLGRLAKIAARATVPFLASGPGAAALAPEFAPAAEAQTAWAALRDLPEAAWLGLAVPRFLLRLPYGENTKSIDPFPYEEFSGPAAPSVYLWANPALAPACLLSMAFLKQGWALKPGELLDLEDMAMHVYTQDDEQQVTIAEAWLTRPIVERLVKFGLMPLLSVRGKNALQLFRMLSLARPPKDQQASDLRGRWGGQGAVKPVRAGGPPEVSVGFGIGGAPAASPARAVTPAADSRSDDETPAPDQESPEAGDEATPAAEEMDPELAALLKQMEDGAAAPPAPPPAEEEMDPELAALMKQLEEDSTAEAPAAETAAQEPAAEEMDPELAALLQQLEEGSPPEPAPAAEPAAGESAASAEEMDPELAALMRELEQGGSEQPAAQAPPEPAPEPTPEAASAAEMDPELAALMRELEGGGEEEPPAPPAEPEPDPELAALMQELEQPSAAEAEAPAAAPEAAPEPTAAEAMDAELAALLGQLERESASQPEAAPDPLQEQIDALGGLAALEQLGWPVFARSFREDRQRQLRLLQGQVKNRTAEREARRLVRICGGYAVLASEGITPQMALNAQLAKLRALRATRERATALTNEELLLMAAAYGARLKSQKSDEAKAGLLLMVQDYDRWASDPRFEDVVVKVQQAPFEERRQTQLQHQFQYLGGQAAFQRLLAEHPQDANANAPLEQKVALLRALREYNWLGGDAAYAEQVGEDGSGSLVVRLEKLRAVVRAQE